MKIAIIGNYSDRRCGFQNFSVQTAVALQRAGHDVTVYDGTYSLVYARREAGQESFLPPDPLSFDVIHVVWHPATMNHYNGAPWQEIRGKGPVLSVWNGCPAAWCPFNEHMDVKWGVLGREAGHKQLFYPIPDWVDNLPEPNEQFTVGYSGVRGDGLGLLTQICEGHGWQTNFSQPDSWLPLEDEVRRLARSTVNVGWYSGVHDDRSGSAMMCLASHRPFLCNDVPMFLHLKPYAGREILQVDDLEATLAQADRSVLLLPHPRRVLQDLSWSRACDLLVDGWTEARS